MSELFHKDLANGHWTDFSLAEQMGNIGSEVSLATNWQGKNEIRYQQAISRGLELFDLTIADHRWHGRLKEIGRAKDVFMDAVTGGTEYHSDLNSLRKYFDQFAYAARR